MKPLITNLETIAADAQRRAGDYDAFAYYVEMDDRSDAELDALVERIAAPVTEAIDCTTCANCCRHLDVFLTEDDAHRLAEGTTIPLETLLETTIDCQTAARHNEWGMFKQKPCRFLQDKRCSIYPHRPESCRLYPQFTPNFRWTVRHTLEGAGLCPIIYNVIERLQDEMDW